MPVIADWTVEIPIEDVFRAMQMDIERVRARRSGVMCVVEEAVCEGHRLLDPVVVFSRNSVKENTPSQLNLANGVQLKNRFLAGQLAQAREMVAAVCSIGARIDRRITEAMHSNQIALGYVLNAFGGVALGQVVNRFCADLQAAAQASGLTTSCQFSPGLREWPVNQGQPALFALLPESAAYVQLSPSMQMIPLKSLSFVIGIGEGFSRQGEPCDLCEIRARCAYRMK